MKKPLALALAAALLLCTLAACQTRAAAPNLPLSLGERYLEDLEYERALLQFEQAIGMEPGNAMAHLGKADALLHLDRREEAAAALALAAGAKHMDQEPREAIAKAQEEVAKSAEDGYTGLAAAYETLSCTDMSLALLKRVTREFPHMQKATAALKRLAKQLGVVIETTTKAPTTTEAQTTTTTTRPPTTPRPTTLPPATTRAALVEISKHFATAPDTLAALLGCSSEGTGTNASSYQSYESADGDIFFYASDSRAEDIRWTSPSVSLFGLKIGDNGEAVEAVMNERGYEYNPYLNVYLGGPESLRIYVQISEGEISYFEMHYV